MLRGSVSIFFNLTISILCLFLPLGACTRQVPAAQLPPGLQLRPVGAVDRDGAFAWAPDGQRIVFANEGTRLRNLDAGGEERLDPATPVALCWSAAGEKLAAAYEVPTGSRILLFVPGSVGPVAETTVPGRVADLFCPDDGSVVAVASVLQIFSFGGNFTTSVYRWDGVRTPRAMVINDVSVKPLTLKNLGASIFDLVHPQLAPLQDELLFTRLHDPPALSPYLKLVQIHLSSGVSQVVADLPLISSGGRYLAAGEKLVVADGVGSTNRLDPWTKERVDTLPLSGRVLATSFAGARLLVDGHLFVDGHEVAVLPGVDKAAFGPSGDRLLLLYDKDLFLLEGLSAEPLPSSLVAPLRQKLLQLRQWRSTGLISHDDYLKKRGEMLP